MTKKYKTPEDAIRLLVRNGARIRRPVKKKFNGKEITTPGSISMNMPGNKCLGAIDYLCNYHKYRHV